MDQKLNTVKNKVSRFGKLARKSLPVRKVLLYGSYAKGNAGPDSDIDVGVVLDSVDQNNLIEWTIKLYDYALEVDVAIEPHCIFSDEYENCEPASVLAEILRTSIEVD